MLILSKILTHLRIIFNLGTSRPVRLTGKINDYTASVYLFDVVNNFKYACGFHHRDMDRKMIERQAEGSWWWWWGQEKMGGEERDSRLCLIVPLSGTWPEKHPLTTSIHPVWHHPLCFLHKISHTELPTLRLFYLFTSSACLPSPGQDVRLWPCLTRSPLHAQDLTDVQ